MPRLGTLRYACGTVPPAATTKSRYIPAFAVPSHPSEERARERRHFVSESPRFATPLGPAARFRPVLYPTNHRVVAASRQSAAPFEQSLRSNNPQAQRPVRLRHARRYGCRYGSKPHQHPVNIGLARLHGSKYPPAPPQAQVPQSVGDDVRSRSTALPANRPPTPARYHLLAPISTY